MRISENCLKFNYISNSDCVHCAFADSDLQITFVMEKRNVFKLNYLQVEIRVEYFW